MTIRRLIAVITLLTSSEAFVQDRMAAAEMMSRSCQNSILANPQKSAAFIAAGTSARAVCDCTAQIAVGYLRPDEVVSVIAGRGISTTPQVAQQTQQAWRFCIVSQMP
jgi:hypothetical protein